MNSFCRPRAIGGYMKRIVLISMMALAVAGAWAQDLTIFQTGFTAFADALAPTLSYNATIGNNWSDAYIGGFPHFGVGVAVGVTTVPVEPLDELFESMGLATLPEALTTYGLPIPAAALTVKIGGFILPFDLGLKGMILPDSLKTTLSDAGIAADYTLYGGNVRFAIVKENILLPDVSIGAGYNRLSGAIVVPLDIEGQSFTFNDGTTDHTLAVTDPDLALRWTTDSYDFTVQVSKNFLFIRPYAGVGYSIGTSSVKGGIESALTYDEIPVTAAELDTIKTSLAAADIAVPDLTADGFLFGKDSTAPALRVYGGVSLAFIIINLDVSAIYVPATESLGASAMLRVQL